MGRKKGNKSTSSSSGSNSSPPSKDSITYPSDSERGWDADMRRFHVGLRHLFSNEMEESEKCFQDGIKFEWPGGVIPEGEHDLRGAFALQYAFIAVVKGILSLSNDQLSECLERVWEADELAANGDQWIGTSIVRGICTLLGGAIQVLQHNFVKGVFNVLKSWMWIKTLKSDKALHFQGRERNVVRSASLFTLGLANLVISLLPPAMVSAASFFSGFQGNGQEALHHLETCWREGGLLAPWSALTWVSFHVDVKTFLGLTQTAQDFAVSEEIMAWAKQIYGAPIFYAILETDLALCQKDKDRAKKVLTYSQAHVNNLKALEWLVWYKRGVIALTDFDWSQAGDCFNNSLKVYVEVDRRSMVPFMSMYSALCYTVAAQQEESKECQEKAGAMIALLETYKAMKKKNWGRQDVYAFQLLAVINKEKEADFWPMLELVEAMVLRMRVTFFMPKEQLSKLVQLLPDKANYSALSQARVKCIEAEVLHKQGDYPAALEACSGGLAFKSSLSDSDIKQGVLHHLTFTEASCHKSMENFHKAKASFEVLNSLPDCFSKKMISFKATAVKKQILLDVSDAFTSAAVNARSSYSVSVPVDDLKSLQDGSIRWEWAVEAQTIGFAAFFHPAGKEESKQPVHKIDKHDSSAGPACFSFSPSSPGKLQLVWDNSFSYLRGKVIKYRLLPGFLHEVLQVD